MNGWESWLLRIFNPKISHSKSVRTHRLCSIDRLETRRYLTADLDGVIGLDDAAGELEPMADFSLSDVNATSSRYGESVSPRDYSESVSAWYFAHST